MGVSLSSNTETIFEFDLPYAIPIPDGSYPISAGTRIGKLFIIRVQREDVAGFTGTGYLQLAFDKYGKSSYSKIKLILPWIVNLKEEGRKPILLEKGIIRLKAKEQVLKILNQFIESVKYIIGEYWIEPARYQDLLTYQIFYLDGQKKYPAMLTLMDSGVGGIAMGNKHPFEMSAEKIHNLNDVLIGKKELDTSHIFLLNAKDACFQEDFRLATVEAVTALEMVLYQFILKRGKKLGIAEGTLRNFIKETGLSGNMKVVLKMLTEGLPQIDDTVINNCKGAITTRNKILHEGFRDVPSTVTEERIIEIDKMLKYLRNLIANV